MRWLKVKDKTPDSGSCYRQWWKNMYSEKPKGEWMYFNGAMNEQDEAYDVDSTVNSIDQDEVEWLDESPLEALDSHPSFSLQQAEKYRLELIALYRGLTLERYVPTESRMQFSARLKVIESEPPQQQTDSLGVDEAAEELNKSKWTHPLRDKTEDGLKPAHKCIPIARAMMSEGRDWWLGKLTEKVEEFPHETHCLHLKTPLKDVVFLCNPGDFQQLTILCRHALGHKISETWMDFIMEQTAIGDYSPSSTQSTSETLKGEAISLLDWMAKNNYGEVGYDYEFGAKFAKFEDNVCCSDYYTSQQLYSLYIKSKEGQ